MAARDGDDWRGGGGGLWRSNEGSEKRELWVKENKNEEEEETEKNRLERETLLDGTSHTGGLHEVKNITILPLSYVTQKLKTPIWCFQFSAL